MQYGKSQEAIGRLTAEQRRVTQEAGTERPFTGEYNDHTEPGIYVDIVSGEPLFASSDKFESGCGWPSFTKPIVSANINELRNTSHGMIRTEVSVVSFRLASHRSALPRFSRACHLLRRFSAKVHQFWVTERSALLRFGNPRSSEVVMLQPRGRARRTIAGTYRFHSGGEERFCDQWLAVSKISSSNAESNRRRISR